MSIHSVNSAQSIYSIESFLVLPKKGYPIRKSPDLRLFAPSRGLSQLITSFIASMCLGIHRTPLVAFTKDFSILRKRVDAYANQIVKKQSKISTKLWSWQGSNLRPQACKARALPTELQPQNRMIESYQLKMWAWEDSNFRPHAYQACALTTWATSPYLAGGRFTKINPF